VPRAARASIDPDRRAGRPAGQRLAAPLLALVLLAPLLLAGCITVNVDLLGRPGPLEEVTVAGEGRDKVLVVDLSGVILGESVETGLLGRRRESAVDRITAQLDKASEDKAVKAVVLRINSPGGTVTASDVIYHTIQRFKAERKVPVVAAFLSVAASGGYYVAMASDEILAHPTTTTGSIGVIVQTLNVVGLFNKLGLEVYTVKSGPFKDIGSPVKIPAPAELAIVQSIINGMFERFLVAVQAGRPRLQPAQIRAAADGRIVSADQALAAGLVDRIGYMADAVERAKGRAGLEKARVVFYVRRGESKPTHLYAGTTLPEPSAIGQQLLARLAGDGGTQFLYLWPGF
jgi:protease-4